MTSYSFVKTYLAVVMGHMPKSTGLIDAPIERKENSIIERCISPTRSKSYNTL